MGNTNIKDEIFEENKKKELISFTQIYETIPNPTYNTNEIEYEKITEYIPNWRDKYKYEWRWRFFNFGGTQYAEISFQKYNDFEKRYYYGKEGELFYGVVPNIYDKYTTKIYYHYK
jgi:hypothetical protein